MRPRTLLSVGLGLVLLASAEAAAAGAHPAYYGGLVVSNPQVVVISYGAVDTTVVNGMAGFYSTILQSPYLDWVSEYSTVGLSGVTDGLTGSSQRIGRGNFLNSYFLTPLAGTTVSNTDILQLLEAEIGLGNIPAPTKDAEGNANTLYMVNLPPGVTLLSYGGATSCAAPPLGFCGTTDTLTVGELSAGVGFVADQSPGSPCTGLCGTDATYFNNVTEVHAHLLLNLVTNVEDGLWNQGGTGTVARPIAWYNVGTEHQVADICTGQPADVGGYTVEMGWSNTQEACVAQAASELPVCTSGTTYCRQCNATDMGQDGGCTGELSACETDATNAAFGECVGCTSGTNCSGTTPVCAKGGTQNDSCRACDGDGECTTNSAGSHCLTSGACGPASSSTASSGCNAAGGGSGTVAGAFGLLALLLRPRPLLAGVRKGTLRRPRSFSPRRLLSGGARAAYRGRLRPTEGRGA